MWNGYSQKIAQYKLSNAGFNIASSCTIARMNDRVHTHIDCLFHARTSILYTTSYARVYFHLL